MPALALVGAALAGAVACSSGDDGGLSLDDLRDTGDTCPVDLANLPFLADQVDAGVEVEVHEGTGDGGLSDPAIDQLGGVHVECRAADGTVAVIYGSEQPNALALLLPMLARDLGLSGDEAEVVLAAYDDAEAGDLVEVGAEGPAAAVRLDIDGAESGVLYLSTISATPEEVASAAEELADDL